MVVQLSDCLLPNQFIQLYPAFTTQYNVTMKPIALTATFDNAKITKVSE